MELNRPEPDHWGEAGSVSAKVAMLAVPSGVVRVELVPLCIWHCFVIGWALREPEKWSSGRFVSPGIAGVAE